MNTIDTNPSHGLALVQETANWRGPDNKTRYVPLADAPAMAAEREPIPQTYLGQLHYAASHTAVGLIVHDRFDPNGNRPPKVGWTCWKNL